MKKNNYLWSYTQWSQNDRLKLENDHTIDQLKTVCVKRYIALSSTVIEKKLFLTHCHKMKKFSYSCEDYALWIDLLKYGHLPFYEENTIMTYNVGVNSLSKNKVRQVKNVFRVYVDAVGLIKAIWYLAFFVKNKVKDE